MALPLFCSLLAAAFAGALIAYVPTARQRNWPVGILFERGTVPTAVYLGVAALPSAGPGSVKLAGGGCFGSCWRHL